MIYKLLNLIFKNHYSKLYNLKLNVCIEHYETYFSLIKEDMIHNLNNYRFNQER